MEQRFLQQTHFSPLPAQIAERSQRHIPENAVPSLGTKLANFISGAKSLHPQSAPREDGIFMPGKERRRYVRIQREFVTEIFNAVRDYQTEGVTENVSQGGAFIKTKDWRAFRTGDQTILILFLPPSFTDRDKSIGLRGEAIIKRIDQKNEGIALEFAKSFQDFEKI